MDISDTENLFNILCDALPILADMSYGYACVTDPSGTRLKTVDSQGQEIVELQGTKYPLAAEAFTKGTAIIGTSQLMPEAESWAIPVGPYVICCNNMTNIIFMRQLEEALLKALPYIVKVVGGDASLYNLKENLLLTSSGDKQIQEDVLGEDLKNLLAERKPFVKFSDSVEGAMKVYIPVTHGFGLVLSNETAILRNKKLYHELKKSKSIRYTLDDLIGNSRHIQNIKSMVECASNALSNVLIMGETGTGKEIIAQAIHAHSPRANKPFIAINCGALPASLIESQLFGYKQGAFTGASTQGQAGIFERANGGTVLLDEIGEMDLELQTKLLRVLQERTVTRIGSVEPIQLNVRIISTTNRDLYQAIKEKSFREDLFFRLNVVNINVPPLRERKEDLPILVKHFINKFELETGKTVHGITPAALNILQQYSWRGNVRELENCIERAFNFIRNDSKIDCAHLPEYIMDAMAYSDSNDIDLKKAIRDAEKRVISKALKITNGDKKQAAVLLGISDTTLWRKLDT
ncbi:sigma-54 interaction domain-containing protein [Candidatus Formimonas warabiya]|uniref:Sigma-54 factor interaction domain-containing protein n=1 Tax=Formimonas warabiya TaxID=1761012 RepID=A0A3G1KV44_FORW1|nr:sigma 54-interacting transcriptional regulator [Candidatus Formimonas warabiya]ATW26311.1 hypothetical protein DCMF_17465 [Candidatus Formimonas warabiya]